MKTNLIKEYLKTIPFKKYIEKSIKRYMAKYYACAPYMQDANIFIDIDKYRIDKIGGKNALINYFNVNKDKEVTITYNNKISYITYKIIDLKFDAYSLFRTIVDAQFKIYIISVIVRK